MVWPTLGSRKAKEQNRTGVNDCLMSNDGDVVIVCMVTAAAVALAMVEG